MIKNKLDLHSSECMISMFWLLSSEKGPLNLALAHVSNLDIQKYHFLLCLFGQEHRMRAHWTFATPTSREAKTMEQQIVHHY